LANYITCVFPFLDPVATILALAWQKNRQKACRRAKALPLQALPRRLVEFVPPLASIIEKLECFGHFSLSFIYSVYTCDYYSSFFILIQFLLAFIVLVMV
jgi:hypothetical protein